MELLSKVSKLKVNINEEISKSERPESMLAQLITEMRQQVPKLKKEINTVQKEEDRLFTQFQREQRLSSEWEKKAMIAVKAGDDELAKEALERKAEHDEVVLQYQRQWQSQRQELQDLKKALRQLQLKIEEAERKKNLLRGQRKKREVQRNIQSAASFLNKECALEIFRQMTLEREELSEIKAEFLKETLNDLKTKFELLETKTKKEQSLEALKRKMGLLPEPGKPLLTSPNKEKNQLK
jgi:phage shock protein A